MMGRLLFGIIKMRNSTPSNSDIYRTFGLYATKLFMVCSEHGAGGWFRLISADRAVCSVCKKFLKKVPDGMLFVWDHRDEE